MEKKLNSKLIYEGRVVKLTVDDVLCDNDIESKREVIHHNGGAAILVVVDNKVLLEKQFRYPFNDYIYEIPAGKLEIGEDPLEAAKRELEEETGFVALDIKDLGCMYPSVGYTNEVIKLYLVTKLKEGKLNLDIDEVIDIEFVEMSKVKEMILNNEIVDAKTLCALYKYNLLGE
ncbi:MAG: NUDIX hydrolase [bacterium]